MKTSKPKRVKFKRYTSEQLVAHAKAHPATSDFAFGERSGGYIVTAPSKPTNSYSFQDLSRTKRDSE